MLDSILKPLVCSNPLAKLARAAIKFEFVNENFLDSESEALKAKGYQLLSKMSHFGGHPHLPKDFVWPCASYKDEHSDETIKRPLIFSAQFDLSEIAPLDIDNLLPHKGLLVFFTIGQMWNFCDYEDSSRVYYFEDIDSLVETKRPDEPQYHEEHEQESCVLAEHLIFAKACWTVPEEYSNILDDQDYECDLTKLGLSKEQISDISENYSQYFQELKDQDGLQEDDEVPSQLLGWGQYIQSDYIGSDNELMLFTLSSFYDQKISDYPLCIGDAGAIYHIIDKGSLKDLKFDSVRSIMDCY